MFMEGQLRSGLGGCDLGVLEPVGGHSGVSGIRGVLWEKGRGEPS